MNNTNESKETHEWVEATVEEPTVKCEIKSVNGFSDEGLLKITCVVIDERSKYEGQEVSFELGLDDGTYDSVVAGDEMQLSNSMLQEILD